MNTLTKFALISIAVGVFAGCSPVQFDIDDSKCVDVGCIVQDGELLLDYTVTAGKGKVDILIVNDNSASMSFEQARLAPRFSNFISDLDNQLVDYRIAMTTTDVTTGKGGKLIDFGNGNSFISSQDSNRQSLFSTTIQRPETLRCEKFIADWIRANGPNSTSSSSYDISYKQNCPSGDERGIYAANLIVKANPANFIRTDAHLAVIFISDEDVRSGLYNQSGFALSTHDQPNTLIENVRSKYGNEKISSMSVHSVVVKDQACLTQQNNQILDNYAPTNQLVSGSIGSAYMLFETSQWGKSADICSSDYTSQLGQIRSQISSRTKEILLKCEGAKNLVVTVSGSNVPFTVAGKTLKFTSYLTPGTNVHLSYKCGSVN